MITSIRSSSSQGWRYGGALVVGLAFSLFTSLAGALPLVNGGFEPDLSGWAILGDVTPRTAIMGVSPTEGTSMAFLTTRGAGLGVFAPGPPNFLFNEIPFLSLKPADLAQLRGSSTFPLWEGSAMRQQVTVQGGDVLEFDYKYVTTESTFPGDEAIVVLTFNGVLQAGAPLGRGSLSTSTFNLCAVVPSLGLPCPLSTPTGESSWQHGSLTIPASAASGDYILGFAVWDNLDGLTPSALFIDNVRLTTVVPEPATWLLLATGCLGLLGYGWRRRVA